MAKILLVEDDNNLREIYEARLQAEGYTIVAAQDGEEALVVAKAEKPDLIIADVMMPKISGFEMLDILRNTDGLKDVKIIMLTALGQSDDQQRADKLGADRYLVKSQVTLEDIVKATQELLGSSAAPGEKPSEPAAPTPAATPAAPEPPAAPAAPTTAEDKTTVPKPAEPAVETKAPETTTPPLEPNKTDTKPVDATPANDAATPEKDEAASVEAKIEDFVAGATTDPTALPATPVAPTPTAAASDSDSAAKANDDKVMAEAVDTLVANADNEPEDRPAAAPPQSQAATPASPPEPEPESSNNVEVAHKKVIKPLEDTGPKKDLDTLLAEEEAKETSAQPGATVTPIVISDDTGPKTITPDTTTPSLEPKSPPDPNSIAL